MKDFEPIDEDTGIEEYPGYIGMTWDRDLYMSDKFKLFEKFDWANYNDLLSELGDSRQITYSVSGQKFTVDYNQEEDLAYLIDQLSTVEAYYDSGPADGGPASGAGFIFFVVSNSTLEKALIEVSALTSALENDLRLLRNG
jgi:hypothetical protein